MLKFLSESGQQQQAQAALLQQQQHQQALLKPSLEDRYHALMISVAELGQDIKPAYAGSRAAHDRLKKGE